MVRVRIGKISGSQVSMVLTLCFGASYLIFALPAILIGALRGAPIDFVGLGLLLILPHLAITYLMLRWVCFIYNRVARMVGGIELELDQND